MTNEGLRIEQDGCESMIRLRKNEDFFFGDSCHGNSRGDQFLNFQLDDVPLWSARSDIQALEAQRQVQLDLDACATEYIEILVI